MTTRQAAAALGITENAVRLRIKRNTLVGRKVGKNWRVYLDEEPLVTTAETTYEQPLITRDDQLVGSLQSEVEFLRSELESRRNEIERRDVMLAQQSAQLIDMADKLQAIPATTAPPPAPERVSSANDDSVPLSDDQDNPEQPATLRRRLWHFIVGPS